MPRHEDENAVITSIDDGKKYGLNAYRNNKGDEVQKAFGEEKGYISPGHTEKMNVN